MQGTFILHDSMRRGQSPQMGGGGGGGVKAGDHI